jgi:small subunit ribosomal protein S16
MPVKIRLARHGKKGSAFYHIVIADSRAPRDGKFIERLGTYNPNTNPATIDFDFERALYWVQTGAQPTDTCRAILSYKGVLYKQHLLNGVKKGAFNVEEAENRFNTWKEQKESKIQAKKDMLADKSMTEKQKRLNAETKVREERAQAISKKLAEQSSSENVEEGESNVEETTS